MKLEYLPEVAPAEHGYHLEVLQAKRASAGTARGITGRLKTVHTTETNMSYTAPHMLNNTVQFAIPKAFVLCFGVQHSRVCLCGDICCNPH